MNSETVYFKVSSSVKKIVGRELITDKNVAIFELVKNSYDAMAKNVKVHISDTKIVIEDDGSGMSKDDLLNKWLFLGYSEKERSKNEDGRSYVGSKGIGRFACDRLGRITKIITKKNNELNEHILDINWDKFENSNKEYFQKIPVEFYEKESNCKSAYTKIIIEKLRDEWKQEEVENLDRLFYKLIDPFESRYSINIYLKFNDGDYIKVENNLVNALQHVTVSIKVSFDDYITMELIDRGTKIYHLEHLENNTLLRNIKMQVTYLNRSAKIRFTRNMGIPCVEYGNVLVYKNGFRIYPIGDPGFDYFGLEYRKKGNIVEIYNENQTIEKFHEFFQKANKIISNWKGVLYDDGTCDLK